MFIVDVDVLADNDHVAAAAGRNVTIAEQFIERDTLQDPVAIAVLTQVDSRVANRHLVDDKLPVGHQAPETHTDADLFGVQHADPGLDVNKPGVVKTEFRTAQAPARVHAREFDVHADRITGPGLDFLLVLRQSWQHQAEDTDGNRKQDHHRRPEIGDGPDQFSQQLLHSRQISTTSNWSFR